jgi:hypothetical protein
MRVEIIDMGLGEEGPDLDRLGWRSWFHFPQAPVLEDLFYDLWVLDERNEPHRPLAPAAGKEVHFPGSSPGQAPIFCISPPEAGKPCPVLAVTVG